MGRSARRGCAACWRAVLSLLFAAGGLVACGPAPSDPALEASAVAAQGAPADRGECRRWTTCTPPGDPCHIGWVTGCRAGVPICTPVGQVDDGVSCGTDHVCFNGSCEPCAAGESCVHARDPYGNPDACKPGLIACGTGRPVCEPADPAPDGTACLGGGPYVCKGGECTWCMEGQTGCVPPEGPCREGVMTSCSTGGTCVATGNTIPNGWSCGGDGSVCREGECVPCPSGPCEPDGMSCYEGYISCWTGWPTCSPGAPKPPGTPCENGGVCQSGTCVQPCLPDQPCTPMNQCYEGRTVCDPFGGSWCQETTPVDDGTLCNGGVCRSGSCSPCGPGSWCPAPTPCFGSGTISCATAQCEPTPPPFPGATCGLGGETCNAEGVCVDDGDARLLVRSASWMVDLTGTTWVRCSGDGSGTSSQRNTDSYGVGTITHVEETFASPDCSGAPLTSRTVNGTVTSAGDRYVRWAGGAPPPSVPWWMTELWATAVRVTGEDQGAPLDFQFLVWVNDWVGPRELFQGEQDHDLAWDGYPSLLVAETHPLREAIACNAGEPCSPGWPTCEVWATDCSSGAPVCAWTGTYLPEGARCGDFLECRSNACVPVPTTTVTGTSLTTYWPDSGPVTTSEPAPLYGVNAVQFASAGVVTRPGTIFGDGSFVIPDVAVGPYQLEIFSPTGISYLALSTSTATVVDLGIDVSGRPGVAFATTPPSEVFFDVKGLVPWTPGDILQFASSNAGVAAMPFGNQESTLPTPGATQLTRPFGWLNKPLLDGAAGDVAYVYQGTTTTGPAGERITAAAGWAELSGPGFAFTDGAGGLVDVTLASCPGRGAISVDWRRLEFEAQLGAIHPEAFPVNHRVVVGARPSASPFTPLLRGELAQYPGLPLLVAHSLPDGGAALLGDLGYGRFLPPGWREYRHDRLMVGVDFVAPGALTAARLNAPLGYDVAADVVAGDPVTPFVVAPIVPPPLGLQIEGLDAWTVGLAGVGTTPRISWIAPAVSPVAVALFPAASLQYTVSVHELRVMPDGTGRTQIVRLFQGRTTRTSYRLPGAQVVPGGTYVVAVEATLTADSPTAPFHESKERAFATVVSRPFVP